MQTNSCSTRRGTKPCTYPRRILHGSQHVAGGAAASHGRYVDAAAEVQQAACALCARLHATPQSKSLGGGTAQGSGGAGIEQGAVPQGEIGGVILGVVGQLLSIQDQLLSIPDQLLSTHLLSIQDHTRCPTLSAAAALLHSQRVCHLNRPDPCAMQPT